MGVNFPISTTKMKITTTYGSPPAGKNTFYVIYPSHSTFLITPSWQSSEQGIHDNDIVMNAMTEVSCHG